MNDCHITLCKRGTNEDVTVVLSQSPVLHPATGVAGVAGAAAAPDAAANDAKEVTRLRPQSAAHHVAMDGRVKSAPPLYISLVVLYPGQGGAKNDFTAHG